MSRWILPLPPNRVRRNYKGGALLDLWEGRPEGIDSECPEDWIASTTRAVNPGLPPIPDEGLAQVESSAGKGRLLDVFEDNPEHFLGRNHVEAIGVDLGFLLKLLDSAMRLHVQAHPDKAFARTHLNSQWGKLETYVILDTRPGTNPYIRLGFQRAPTADEWRRIVLEQDIAAMDACFDRVPVRRGEVWVIPGGLPHAIGEGLLVLETMEPTDLVVRCEFEREGIAVPPQARFMQRDPDFALQIFDLTPLSVDDVTQRCRVHPTVIEQTDAWTRELLIGPDQTSCFSIFRTVTTSESIVRKAPQVHVAVVTGGSGEVRVRDESITVRRGARFLIPAAADRIQFCPTESRLETVLVRPGETDAGQAR